MQGVLLAIHNLSELKSLANYMPKFDGRYNFHLYGNMPFKAPISETFLHKQVLTLALGSSMLSLIGIGTLSSSFSNSNFSS